MRHRKAGKQLGRNTSHRRAMLRNMVTSLFEHEQIVTTDAKAKVVRPVAEKMITLAKTGGSPCKASGSCLYARQGCNSQAVQ